MDDFDDFISHGGRSGQPPPEGTASHRPVQQSNNPYASTSSYGNAVDPFASTESLGLGASSSNRNFSRPGQGSTSNAAAGPSHVLYDEEDLLGDDFGSQKFNSSQQQSQGRSSNYPPSIRSSMMPDESPTMMSTSRMPYSDGGPLYSQEDFGPLSQRGAAPGGTNSPFADVYAVRSNTSGNFKSIEADDDPDTSHEVPYSYGQASGSRSGPRRSQPPANGSRFSVMSGRKGGAAGVPRLPPRDGIFDGVKRSYRAVKDEASGMFKGKAARERVPEGERVVRLNDPVTNDKDGQFRDNYISTSKFNVITFTPKFLVGEYTAPR